MKKLLIFLLVLSSQVANAKFMAISLNPVASLIGFTQYNLDFAIGKKFTIGASMFDIDINDNYTIFQDGDGQAARLTYYFTESFTDSWFIMIESGTLDTKLHDLGNTNTANVKTTYTAALVGKHWQWPTCFISWGLGSYTYKAELSNIVGSINADDAYENDGFGGELRMGLAF